MKKKFPFKEGNSYEYIGNPADKVFTEGEFTPGELYECISTDTESQFVFKNGMGAPQPFDPETSAAMPVQEYFKYKK